MSKETYFFRPKGQTVMFKNVLSQKCNKLELLSQDPELKNLQNDLWELMEFLKLVSCHLDEK